MAAQRDYWILTPQLLQPRFAALPDGSDPAELVATGSAPQLVDALCQARPLADVLIDERLANLARVDAALAAAPVIAAQPVDAWEPAVRDLADRLGVDTDILRSTVLPFIRAWNNNPTRLADQQLGLTTQIRDRLTAAANVRRWEALANKVDPRLIADPHWRTLTTALHEAHTHRIDVPDAITVALEDGPLNQDAPAADLANRLERLIYPEPFTGDQDGPVVDAPHDYLPPSNWPNHDREPMSW